eukprot:4543337-Alexandrium_andersonii.AAC.1
MSSCARPGGVGRAQGADQLRIVAGRGQQIRAGGPPRRDAALGHRQCSPAVTQGAALAPSRGR